MSTKVFGGYPDELDPFSSLEYLVSPVQPAPAHRRPEFDEAQALMRSEFNNSLQKLTNLVYLLARDTTDERDKRTTLVLLQSEVAHLAVLARRAGLTISKGEEREAEVTQ